MYIRLYYYNNARALYTLAIIYIKVSNAVIITRQYLGTYYYYLDTNSHVVPVYYYYLYFIDHME